MNQDLPSQDMDLCALAERSSTPLYMDCAAVAVLICGGSDFLARRRQTHEELCAGEMPVRRKGELSTS